MGQWRTLPVAPCRLFSRPRGLAVGKYKCSLLVVDDEPCILATLASLLESDFDVLTADSGEAAQRQFARRDIDLVLSDQRMPRMSGVHLLEWVRCHHPKTVRL